MTKGTPDNTSQNSETAGAQDNTRDMPLADHTVMIDVPRELGSHRLTRLLGRGGMGEVWQAFDKNLERDVAIKLMRKELLQNEDATRRFAREARAVARLNHPNIVQVYAFGDEKGLMYFVMELVEGETVAQRLKREHCIPLDDAIFIIMQAIEGLGYACERGIIHRDIKPSNLMVTPDHRIKIADFGLAKMVEHDTQMTAAGTAMGSPNYMSPEQARGEEADHRSDIYALGVSLYQMLCGGLPFTANSPLSVLLKQIQEPLPEPDNLRAMKDGAILNVIKKMTAKNPADRYQTYTELASAIAALAPAAHFRGAHTITASMPVAGASAPQSGSTANLATPASGDATSSPRIAALSTAPGAPIPPADASTTPVPPSEFAGKPIPPAPSATTGFAPSTSTPTPETLELRSRLIWIAVASLCTLLIAAGVLWYTASIRTENDDDNSVASSTADTLNDEDLNASQTATAPRPSSNTPPAANTPGSTPVSPSPATPSPALTPLSPTAVTNSNTAAPAPQTANSASPTAAAGTQPGPALPSPTSTMSPVNVTPTMSPVNVTAMVIGSPTPFPGQQLTITPRPSLNSLMPSGITVQNQTPGLAAAAVPVQAYVLGTAGAAPGEMVPTFRDTAGRVPYKQYPAGTSVTLIDQTATMLRITTPDGPAAYVYKKMATKH